MNSAPCWSFTADSRIIFSMPTFLCAYRVRTVLCVSALLMASCGGRTGSDGNETIGTESDGSTGGSPNDLLGGSASYTTAGGTSPQTGGRSWAYTAGGAPMPATGGKAFSTGGAPTPATGGKAFSTGGAPMPATGGKAFSTGGAPMPATGGKAFSTGGAPMPATGGKAFSTGGSSAVSCAGVVCAAIPTTCTQIVQAPGACCPTCLDSGCPPCANVTCPTGTHLELAVGACCETCVADPPDPCTTGQQSYASMRASMMDKYGSSGCKNSTECVIIPENNSCTWTCGIATPSSMSSSFQSNLDSSAKSYCASCKPPPTVLCELTVPACVNAKCVAVNSP
jgi:hypothetical protein